MIFCCVYRMFCMCLFSTGGNSSDIFVLYTDCFVCVCFLRVAIPVIFSSYILIVLYVFVS